MSGRILQAMMMILTCYVAGQQHRSVAAEANSGDVAVRLERLEKNMQKQNEINSQQAGVIAEQSARIAGLELENQKQTNVNAEQTEMIHDLGLESQKQVGVIAEQSQMISDLKVKQSQQDNIVAFTASASVKRVYNASDRVLFDFVLRNYGDSYDSVNSIFTCSVSGYYIFSVTVMTDEDHDMHAQIWLDDTPLVAVYAYNWDAGSNMVVTYCAGGQAVWVKCHDGQGRVMWEDGDRYSTFSGTLLTLA